MNESKETCAPENVVLTYTERWQRIDRRKAEDYVRKLQARIVKAQREGKYGKVKSLQWLLTHSFYGRYLAVVRVTANKGKNTAGVDRVKWSFDAAKAKAIDTLKPVSYTHLTLPAQHPPPQQPPPQPSTPTSVVGINRCLCAVWRFRRRMEKNARWVSQQ